MLMMKSFGFSKAADFWLSSSTKINEIRISHFGMQKKTKKNRIKHTEKKRVESGNEVRAVSVTTAYLSIVCVCVFENKWVTRGREIEEN